MEQRYKIRIALLSMALGCCTPALACTDEGTLLASHKLILAANTAAAALVQQQGQDLLLEVVRKNGSTRYNLPNDRIGIELVYFKAQSQAEELELCVRSVFQHPAPAPAVRINIIKPDQTEAATLEQYSEAARLWALASAQSQQQAIVLLVTIALQQGADTYQLAQWSKLAAIRAYIRLSDFPAALALADNYQLDSSADTQVAAAAALARGLAHLRMNHDQTALENFRLALARNPDLLTATELRNLIGEALLGLGQIEEGATNINAALATAGDDHALLARIHNNLGYVWLKQAYANQRVTGDAEQLLLASIDEHLVARAFAISAQEKDELLLIENNLGTLYERVGELRNASQHYRESLKLADVGRDPLGVRVIYQNLGSLSQKLGDYIKAKSYLESARALAAASNSNSVQRLDCLLGRNYRLMRDYGKAIDIHQECRRQAAQAGNQPMEMEALADLADDYLERGRGGANSADLERAWQLIQQAKALWDRSTPLSAAMNTVRTVADSSLCQLGTTADSASGSNLRSEADITLALTILSRHALLAARGGHQQLARQSLQQAASLAELPRYPEQIDYLNAAIQTFKQAGDRKLTLRCGAAALALVETLHAGLAAERNGAAWSARTHEIYVTLADMLLEAGLRQKPDASAALEEQAFGIVERSRAINLRQQLAMPKPADSASVEQQKLRTSLARIAASSTTGVDIAGMLPTAYYHQYDLLELARLADVKSVPVPPTLRLRDIQKRLGSQQQVLYYFLADNDCYLFEISAASFRTRKLGNSADLQALLKPVINAEKSPSAFPLQDLQKLSRFLLPDDLAAIAPRELLIVPHRGLDTLPFAALQLPGADSYRPLVETFSVKEIPSLSAYFMKKSRHAVTGRKDIAVFADPVFSPQGIVAADNALLTDNFRTGKDDSFRNWTGTLARLPYTGIEAKNLLAGFNKGQVLEFTAEKATLANLVSPAVRSARILHIATHGYFHSTSSDNVGLVLSAVDEHHNDVANFVTLTELLGHAFDNELVVISGCDTAMGLELTGEGMMGLARGFLAQGAGQVVSTLWPVSDRASAEFMRLFYQHLHENRDVASALQQAQVELSRNPAWQNPFYWAGYVLTSVTPGPLGGLQ